jgi:hypothetical protein
MSEMELVVIVVVAGVIDKTSEAKTVVDPETSRSTKYWGTEIPPTLVGRSGTVRLTVWLEVPVNPEETDPGTCPFSAEFSALQEVLEELKHTTYVELGFKLGAVIESVLPNVAE